MSDTETHAQTQAQPRPSDAGATDASPIQTGTAPEARRQLPTDDELTVHYPCKYVPVELLAGFGAGCWPCTYEAHSFEEADQLAHPNLCGYGKSLLAYAMQPDVRVLVLTSCCDVMRRVYDVLRDAGAVDFLWLVDLPHLRGPREVARFRGELRRLADAFAAWSGRAFNLGRALASFVPPVPRMDDRVTLLGAHGPLSLVDTCRDELSLPVENGTCTGWRLVQTPPPTLGRAPHEGSCHVCQDGCEAGIPRGDDLDRFLDWYAGALLNQMPCMRMVDSKARAKLVGAPGQRGAIYHTMKFCDYYGFEYLEAARARCPCSRSRPTGRGKARGSCAPASRPSTRPCTAWPRRTRSPRGGVARTAAPPTCWAWTPAPPPPTP